MRRCCHKVIKAVQRFLIYLIEDVCLVHYFLFFISGILLLSSIYFVLTPYSHGIGSNGLPLKNLTFWDSIYFSIVTISSLGYGDMHPMGISKLITCAEVLLGLILMGIMLAKMTSARLSYHVARLFSSEIQKRIEEFAEGFNNLQIQITEATKIIGQAFQETPGSTPSYDRSNVVEKLSRVIVSFHNLSIGITEYLSYEVQNGDFFVIAPINVLKRTAEAIEQTLFLLGQMILSMTSEGRILLLNPVNRKRISEALEKQKQICSIVDEYCREDSVKQNFTQISQTCNSLPESFFSIPVSVAEAEQPDQKLESTDQPLEEERNES